jgi:hypothetical protein
VSSGSSVIGEFQLVGHAGTAGSAHAQLQADALAALGEEVLDVRGGAFGQGDSHDENSERFSRE